MQPKHCFSLLHDAQDIPVCCRCVHCGGEIYRDGSEFCRWRVCWFCCSRNRELPQ